MVEQHSREVWTKETRSRAQSSVWISNIALFTFWAVFHQTLSSPIFTALLLLGAGLQIWRTYFLMRFRHLANGTWLRLNDRTLLAFSAFWFTFSTWVATQTAPDAEHASLNAFMIVLGVGYVASSSQFFTYSRKVFYVFLLAVAAPASAIASNFAVEGYQRALLALLPFVYAGLQIRTRAALWRAIFNFSDKNLMLTEALNTLPMGVAVLRDGRYEVANGYAAQLMDRSIYEVVGQPLGFTSSTAEFSELIEDFLESEETLESFEEVVSTPEGPRAHIVLLRRVPNMRDETDSIIVVGLDIEALSETERELEKTRTLLKQASIQAEEAAGAMSAPLRTLTEQVLVSASPDLETTRDCLLRMQMAINKIKGSR